VDGELGTREKVARPIALLMCVITMKLASDGGFSNAGAPQRVVSLS
jgi:hypothetical protein